jgi:TonB family protein
MKKNKVKILSEVPELPDHEVKQLEDFSGLMHQYQDYSTTLVRSKIVSAVSIVAALCIMSYYFYQTQPGTDLPKPTPTGGFIGPLQAITPAWLGAATEGVKTPELTSASENQAPKNSANGGSASAGTKKIESKQPLQNSATDETQPEPAKDSFTDAAPLIGMQELYTWINSEIVYPKELTKDSVEGVVMVQFTVEADSAIAQVKVVRSLGDAFDKEALRVIEAMPRWRPATGNGVPFSQRFTLPVRFAVSKKEGL